VLAINQCEIPEPKVQFILKKALNHERIRNPTDVIEKALALDP